jgi:protein-tyrosine phosphatase
VRAPEMGLDGAINLRDLGALATTDGRLIAGGRIFRSGHLSGLTSDAAERLVALGVGTIFDLRSKRERLLHPTPDSILRRITHRQFQKSPDVMAPVQLFENYMLSVEQSRRIMHETYRMLPMTHGHAYGALFSSLADGDAPVLFHCAAGKDRTGVAAALLLSLLGVAEDDIYMDYVASNHAMAAIQAIVIESSDVALDSHSLEALTPVVEANPSYLDAMFGSIKENHGDVSGYARTVLGMSPLTLHRLREQVLR